MLTLWIAVGWGSTQNEPSFGGGGPDNTSVKSKLINLINSVRTLMRSESCRKHMQKPEVDIDAVPLIFLNLLIIIYSIAFG
jgi:hypothetical protein